MGVIGKTAFSSVNVRATIHLGLLIVNVAIGLRCPGQTTATWIGPAGGNYSNPANWNIGVVPINGLNGSDTYAVEINSGSVKFDVPGVGHQINKFTLGTGATLSLNSTTELTVLSDASINGLIQTNNATFIASAPQATFPGDIARVLVLGGSAAIAATQYTSKAVGGGDLMAAESGGVLNVQSIQSINSLFDVVNGGATRRIAARSGGTVNLSGLTSVTGAANDETLEFLVEAGSTLNLDSLQQVNGGNVLFTLDSAVDFTNLTSINGAARFRPAAGMTLQLPNLANFNGGGTAIRGDIVSGSVGTVNAPKLASLQNMNLQLEDGSQMNIGGGLPVGSSVVMNGVDIKYNGAGTLNAPKLGSFINSSLALGGAGQVFNGPQVNRIDGSINGSTISITGPRTFTVSAGSYDTGTRFASGDLLAANGSGAVLNASSIATINSFYDLVNGGATRRIAARSGGTVNLSGLTSVTGAANDETLEFLVEAGSTLSLDSLQQVNGGNVLFTLDSAVDFTNLTSINGAARFRPAAGMTLQLPNLANFNGGGTAIRGDIVSGSVGTVNAPKLASLQNMNLQLEDGSQMNIGGGLPVGSSVVMNGVDIKYNGAGTLNAPKLGSFINSSLALGGAGQVFNGPQANRIDGSITGSTINITGPRTFTVSAGSYDTGTRFGSGDLLSANGSGAVLNASSVATINGFYDVVNGGATRRIAARSGGTVNLSGLTSVTGAANDETLEFVAESGSFMNLSNLSSIAGRVGFRTTNGGQLNVEKLLSSDAVFVTSSGSDSAIDVTGSVTLNTASTVNIAAGGKLRVGGNFSYDYTSANPSQFQFGNGTLQMEGNGLQSLEVGDVFSSSPPVHALGGYALGQLAIGDITHASTVQLVDLKDNTPGGAPEGLHLFGFGSEPGLQLLNGSKLILNNVDTYSWDPLASNYIHLNSLFGPGQLTVPFGGGTLQKVAEVGPFAWINPGSGSWSNLSNWLPHFNPSGDFKAIFGNGITAPATITVDSAIQISQIEFNNSSQIYTIAGDGLHGLELISAAEINVAAGSHTISAPISGVSGLTKIGAGTLQLSGNSSYSGPTLIRAGTLKASSAANFGATDTITVDYGATLDVTDGAVYQLQSGQTLTGRGTVKANVLSLQPNSALRGALQTQGTVNNNGLVAPGFSPEIMVISGNYSQQPAGALEMEVGGTIPGTQHDMLIVTGTASLAGHLNVPIVSGYVPQVDDEVQLLLAGNVAGTFDSTFFPNLPASVAHELEYSSNGVRLKFVAPTPIQFVSPNPVATWSSNASWEENGMAATPESKNVISVENLAGVTQRVELAATNESVHFLTVGDPTTGIAVRVNAVSLSVAAGTVIEDNGAIELANSGTLVSQSVDVQDGGVLTGNGTVKTNNLVVSDGTLRPGFSVGHIDVDGAYQQDANGTLLVDIESTSSFDSVDVAGSATLGGTLEIDASNLTSVTPGTLFPIVTASSITGDFESVKSTGNNNIYFHATTIGNTAYAEFQDRGDMNGDDVIDSQDFDLFAFGLMNRSTSRYFAKCNCDILPQQGGDFSGNGRLDFDDIAGFQSQMSGMGMSSDGLMAAIDHYLSPVPEPSSAVLLMFGGVLANAMRGKRVRRDGIGVARLATRS